VRDDAVILAHATVGPSELAGSWTFEPTVILALVVTSVVYARGRARLGRRIGHRTGGAGRVAAFYGALVVVAAALLSPLDGLASTLFSAHMVQHLLLMLVAAPLAVYARPAAALVAGLPARARPLAHRARGTRWDRLRDAALNPLVVWTVGTVALWAWHMPALYEGALSHAALHALEHATFFGAALLFWSVVLASGTRRGVPRPIAALLVLASSVQSSALGAVLLFGGRPLYDSHLAGTAAWDTTPLQDQQLAGAVMWGPPAVLYVVVIGWLLVRWFSEMEAATPEPVRPITVETA
jgi:putative membrane protein